MFAAEIWVVSPRASRKLAQVGVADPAPLPAIGIAPDKSCGTSGMDRSGIAALASAPGAIRIPSAVFISAESADGVPMLDGNG